jgi:2-aminoadipate transaminase
MFADRMKNVHKSFIREILKFTSNHEVISFAGGLPNPCCFPVKEIRAATDKVLQEDGCNVLQYSTTEGYLPLRQFIARRYLDKKGLKIDPDEILITNGSQQGIDLIGKVFLNKNDDVIIERPGYLGTLQSLSIFEPRFHPVTLVDDGIDTGLLKKALEEHDPKLYCAVTNFQNPSGITYSKEKRAEVAGLLDGRRTLLVEDDPYGELRFSGKDIPSIKAFMKNNVILLGSFSKIVAPGLRLGWIHAEPAIMEKLIIAKQASDLHTNYFAQRVLYRYLSDNNVDAYIEKTRQLYKKQRDCMVAMIEKYFPGEVTITRPEGGMFLWATLPEKISAMKLFELAAIENVAFVPGLPFYTDGKIANTLRLNYTNSDETAMEEGIKRLARVMKKLL